MLPLLVVIGDIVGFVGGFLIFWFYGFSPVVVIESAMRMLDSWDILSGLIKAFVFGIVIALVACVEGLHTVGGSQGIGLFISRAVVKILVLIFVLNYFLSQIMYG